MAAAMCGFHDNFARRSAAMKNTFSACLIAALFTTQPIWAQTAAPTGQKTLAATLGVYVFPAAGQASDQQSKDEAECYNWAVTNTGVDPFQLSKQAAEQQQQAQQAQQQAAQTGRGAGLGGAVGGAALGAIVGEVADNDVGKSAAIGAGVGAIAARRRAGEQQQQAVQSAQQQDQQAQAATQEDQSNFKKAFSVCLEAKKYMVKM
jgi:hypothetical protein